MIQFHNKEHQYSVTGYDITTLALYVFCVAHNTTHETGVDDEYDVVLCTLLCRNLISFQSISGESLIATFILSLFLAPSAMDGMASFMRPIWLKKQPLQRYTTTCLVTIVIQRGCCQKGHLKMIHIYQCLLVPFPYRQ